MVERSQTRKPRRDKGIRLLTERDVWIFHWIAEQSCVRFDQLQRLLSRQPQHRNRNAPGPNGLTSSAVDQVVTRWMQDPALVQYKRSYVGQPGWIWLTTYAERTFDLGFDTSYQRHERDFVRRYTVNQIRLYCEERYPEASWRSERQLQRSQEARAGGPAGELWLAPERYIAIECAQLGQSSDEIAEVLRALLCGYQTIWYFSSAVQQGVVEQAQKYLPVECRACVQLMDIELLH